MRSPVAGSSSALRIGVRISGEVEGGGGRGQEEKGDDKLTEVWQNGRSIPISKVSNESFVRSAVWSVNCVMHFPRVCRRTGLGQPDSVPPSSPMLYSSIWQQDSVRRCTLAKFERNSKRSNKWFDPWWTQRMRRALQVPTTWSKLRSCTSIGLNFFVRSCSSSPTKHAASPLVNSCALSYMQFPYSRHEKLSGSSNWPWH